MTDKDYIKMMEFKIVGSALIPVNQNAYDLVENNRGTVTLKEVTARDVKFHRAYFKLLAFIYDWLPLKFKQTIPPDKFYIFLKHLQGKYNPIFEFKEGPPFIEYESISFGRMTELTFRAYVKEQLPVIYNELLLPLYHSDTEKLKLIWDSVEEEFENLIERL